MATQVNKPLAHLHYGGSFNPKSGRYGPKPALGTQFKKQKRLELMVRLENGGIPEAAAASMLCISLNRFKFIKRSPEYAAARIKITHGLIINQEGELDLIKAQRKEMLTQMLPPALLTLANELMTPAVTLSERRHKVDVARDVLDREGTFAKVSRTEVKPVDHFDFEAADRESSSIINAIRAAAPQVQLSIGSSSSMVYDSSSVAPLPLSSNSIHPSSNNSIHAAGAIEINEEFANSHTLSMTDQELALKKLEEEAALSGFDGS